MKYLALSSLILTITFTLANAYGAENQAGQNDNKSSTPSPSEFIINSGYPNQQHAIAEQSTHLQRIWLNADSKKKFLVIITDQQEQEDAKGAVIILHDQGQHLLWPSPFTQLYQSLPEHGWTVLALQLPTIYKTPINIKNNHTQEIINQRLWLSIELLRAQGLHNIVVLVTGHYADNVLNYLANQTTLRVYGLIFLNAQTITTTYFYNFKQLKELPILDLYTLQSHNPKVKFSALMRKASSRRAGNQHYQQGFFLSEAHNFSETQNMLANRIYSWLNINIKSVTTVDGNIKTPYKK